MRTKSHVGSHVAKFQIACNHRGTPIWFSGPHIGSTHDLQIWKDSPAPLKPRERWLADKAYCNKRIRLYSNYSNNSNNSNIHICIRIYSYLFVCDSGHAELIAPYKKPNGKTLQRVNKCFNKIHAWYRTTVEHCIGYLKRYRILSSVYRGRFVSHRRYLQRAAKIIICLSVMHCERVPLRTHRILRRGFGFVWPVRFLPIAIRIKSHLIVRMRFIAIGSAFSDS